MQLSLEAVEGDDEFEEVMVTKLMCHDSCFVKLLQGAQDLNLGLGVSLDHSRAMIYGIFLSYVGSGLSGNQSSDAAERARRNCEAAVASCLGLLGLQFWSLESRDTL